MGSWENYFLLIFPGSYGQLLQPAKWRSNVASLCHQPKEARKSVAANA